MSTTPDDNNPANNNPGLGDTADARQTEEQNHSETQIPQETGSETDDTGGPDDAAQYPDDAASDDQFTGATGYAPVAGEPRTGGVFSAETFALTGVFLLAVTVFSGQLIQIFGSVLLIGDEPVQAQEVAQLNSQVIISGLLAALTVVLAGLGLALSGRGTRPWARWVATATLIVGVLFILLAVATYLQVPVGAEPEMPPMPTK